MTFTVGLSVILYPLILASSTVNLAVVIFVPSYNDGEEKPFKYIKHW